MRRIILFLTPLLILTILFLLLVLIVNKDNGRGALQVTSVPPSQIYIDEKYVGKAPLCLCELSQLLKVGDYNIKLVPVQSGLNTLEQKVTIYKGVLTVIDRTFEKQISASSGSIITLASIDSKNSSEILLISFPNKATVILDSNTRGTTPLLLKDITPSDHEIKIIKDGYKEKILKVKTIEGKRLEAAVSLGIKADITPGNSATKSAPFTSSQKVIILDTPTGFLRVRAEASIISDQVGTISPGQKADLIGEKEEWYEIKLANGKTGWISSTYARKQ